MSAMSEPMLGRDIDNRCAVFIARRISNGTMFLTDDSGDRAVVLESNPAGAQRVLIVAPDDTDTIEHVRIDADREYTVAQYA